jgi:hypothetical protein
LKKANPEKFGDAKLKGLLNKDGSQLPEKQRSKRLCGQQGLPSIFISRAVDDSVSPLRNDSNGKQLFGGS